MVAFIGEISVNQVLMGGGIFTASFLVMLIVWSALLRTIFSVMGKSKFYFVPRTLKELFFSFAFIFVLLSLAVAVAFVDRGLLSGEILKILEILIIFAVANIVVRLVLTGIDVQQKRAKDRSGIYRSIGLVKSTAGIILYLFAILLSINVLSADIGSAVMVSGFFLVVLLFAAGFDQVKSIIAGFQLGDYYVDAGHLIKINGNAGFVESVHGRSTLLKTIEGKTIVIPNFQFFNRQFEIDPEEISEMYVLARVSGKDSVKIKERISAISSKIAIDLEDISDEYKPGVFYSGVEEGVHSFKITFKISPESKVRKVLDRFCTEMSKEFRDRLKTLRLGEY
ncbi:mechanosensitive ion channel [Candidatus Micrarchaeota archaeon]|nr:mechanosensitive ion channel [Candidatus Micrarchaeota archaeon]